jgi:hypothetical protein
MKTSIINGSEVSRLSVAIQFDAVAIYYFKLNAPVTIVVTTFLVLFGLSFAYVDTTKRSERHFAERRKAQAQGATFSMMWDALDSDAKQLFTKKLMWKVHPASLSPDTSNCRTKSVTGTRR